MHFLEAKRTTKGEGQRGWREVGGFGVEKEQNQKMGFRVWVLGGWKVAKMGKFTLITILSILRDPETRTNTSSPDFPLIQNR